LQLIRASLKSLGANRSKTDDPTSRSMDCHRKLGFPGVQECVAHEVTSVVQQTSQSTFEDLCRIYPCHRPVELPQQDAAMSEDTEQCVDLAAKIDRLGTADIVKILLQPAVLNTVVVELENSFLSK